MPKLSSSLFRLIFACYPSHLRRAFGDEIVDVFLEDLSNAGRRDGLAGAIRVWKRSLVELFGICLPFQFAKPSFIAPVISIFWCSGVGIWLVRRETRILGWPGLIAAAISFLAVRYCRRPMPMASLQSHSVLANTDA